MAGGLPTEAKKIAKTVVDEISKKLSTNRITIKDAIKSLKNLNEVEYGSEFTKEIQQYTGPFRGALNEIIDSYGKTNKVFYKAYRAAKDGWSALSKGKEALGGLMKNINPSRLTLPEITIGLLAQPYGFIGSIGGIGTWRALKKVAAPALNMILTNPALARQYAKVMAPAIAGNMTIATRELYKLDKALAKKLKRR